MEGVVMPNTVVTSTTNGILVVFNDDSSKAGGYNKIFYQKANIINVELGSNHVEVHLDAPLGYPTEFQCVNTDANEFELTIDSINGASPSSLSDLFDKITGLLG